MTNTQPIGNFEYVKPDALAETLDVLKNNGDQANVMAGGTDLILQMKQKQRSPSNENNLLYMSYEFT